MKKTQLLYLFALCLLSSACLSTLELRLYQLPEVSLPPHLKQIGLMDHSQEFDPELPEAVQFSPVSLPSKIEDLPTEALPFAPLIGAKDYASNHTDSLNMMILDLQLRRPLPDSFPPPLPAAVVAPLLQKYGLDGLLVMEYYQLRYRDMPREPGFAERFKKGELVTGWRVYDGTDAEVVYEDIFVQELPYVSYFTDKTAKNIRTRIIRETAQVMGMMAGETIVKILTRTYVEDERKIYTGKFGPTDEIAANMKTAGEYAQAGKWEQAMELWRPVASHRGYGRTSSKAAFNMAVGCEHMGQGGLAIDWAQAARQQGLPEASEYLEFLLFKAREE